MNRVTYGWHSFCFPNQYGPFGFAKTFTASKTVYRKENRNIRGFIAGDVRAKTPRAVNNTPTINNPFSFPLRRVPVRATSRQLAFPGGDIGRSSRLVCDERYNFSFDPYSNTAHKIGFCCLRLVYAKTWKEIGERIRQSRRFLKSNYKRLKTFDCEKIILSGTRNRICLDRR